MAALNRIYRVLFVAANNKPIHYAFLSQYSKISEIPDENESEQKHKEKLFDDNSLQIEENQTNFRRQPLRRQGSQFKSLLSEDYDENDFHRISNRKHTDQFDNDNLFPRNRRFSRQNNLLEDENDFHRRSYRKHTGQFDNDDDNLFPRNRRFSRQNNFFEDDLTSGKRNRSYQKREEIVEDVEAENELEQLRRKHRSQAAAEGKTDSEKTFDDFNLHPSLLKQLKYLGYDQPFEIQTKTLDYTLNGVDVIGRAVTGSGKTLAFSIPIVQKLLKHSSVNRSPRAIVLAPTRELSNQIYRSIQELDPTLRCLAMYGGASINRQMAALNRGVDVICATPGRLNDHIERQSLNLSNVEFICLDEADELLTPHFKEQIEDVLIKTPQGRQCLLFSATMPEDIREIGERYMNNPVFIDIAANQKLSTPKSVEHQCIQAEPRNYLKTILSLIKSNNAERCIVFFRMKVLTERACDLLRKKGLRAQAINSNFSQARRESVMRDFRLGHVKVLCATDVAARGLDIPEVDLIIQVEPPEKGVDYYIHRAGRTGRAGRKGLAILIHNREQRKTVREIQRFVPLQRVQLSSDEELLY